MFKWKKLFWCLIFIDWIPSHLIGIEALQNNEEKLQPCKTNSSNDTWYLENEIRCCPCSSCPLDVIQDDFKIKDCYGDTREFFCKVEELSSKCIEVSSFKSTTTTSTVRSSTNAAIIKKQTQLKPSSSTPHHVSEEKRTTPHHVTVHTPFKEPTASNHYLAITAIATVLILLLLTIFVCKKRKLPLRAKKLMQSCQGDANESDKKEPVSIESDSFISQSETLTEDSRVSQKSSLSQEVADNFDLQMTESYEEQPVITEEKGGRDDNPLSLPPVYEENSYRQNHSSSHWQRQPSTSYSGPSFGFGYPSYQMPPNIPHPSYGRPSHYPPHFGPPNTSYPFSQPPNVADPLAHRFLNYPNSSPYSSAPQTLPVGNYAGAVVINNVQVGGSLNINSNGQTPGGANADQPTNAPTIANTSASIQPSSFGDTDLSGTSTSSKLQSEPAADADCKVGQRAVYPSLNDYDEARRRQGNTMESQSDIHIPKHSNRSDQSHRSLAFDFKQLYVSKEPERSFSSQRSSAYSETSLKFFEHSGASKRQPIPPEMNAACSTTACDNPSLSRPIQEMTGDDSAPQDTSIANVDIYRSENASLDAYSHR